MGTSHGSNADFIGNGYVLSNFLHSASFSGSRDASESTTFKKKSKTYIPGLKDTTMNAEGIYDGALNAVDEVMSAAMSGPGGLFSYFPEGQEVAGRRAYTMDTVQTSYEVATDIGDVAQISAEFSAGSEGVFTRGIVAHPMAVEPVTGTGPAQDYGAAATQVVSLVVHATASANLFARITHCDTETGTYVNLPGIVSFGTSRGSQRLIVPKQLVNRWTKIFWGGGGTFVAILERYHPV